MPLVNLDIESVLEEAEAVAVQLGYKPLGEGNQLIPLTDPVLARYLREASRYLDMPMSVADIQSYRFGPGDMSR